MELRGTAGEIVYTTSLACCAWQKQRYARDDKPKQSCSSWSNARVRENVRYLFIRPTTVIIGILLRFFEKCGGSSLKIWYAIISLNKIHAMIQ